MKGILTRFASSARIRETPLNRSVVALAVVLFVAGVTLSRRVEPGVRVESVTLAGRTPALKFLPPASGPHPIALLAHGFTASKETLFRFGEAFAAAGFVCFAVDFPGHGESPKLFSFPPLETVRTLEEVTRGLGRVDVFAGHSMGAYAGAAAVDDAVLSPALFISVGALPKPFEHGPPLLLLAGRFDELLPRHRLMARKDARLILSSWSDHALEPYDPCLVRAAVEAACGAVGKTAPAGPTNWLWRVAGVVLGIAGALGVAIGLPEIFPRFTRIRGLLLPLLLIVACGLTLDTWFGAAPHLRRIHLLIGGIAIALAVIIGASRLRVPRWSFPVLAVAVAIGCAIVGAFAPSSKPSGGVFHLLAFLVLLFAMVLFAGAVLGRIAAHRGSRLDGDLTMAIFVGYVIGQWMPRFF
jgi:pimeloyl-ACP methyl ester carboxylesterase